MYACVRAYSYTGLIEEKCRHLVQESEYNDYKTTVYDLDANSDSWKSIKKVLCVHFSMSSRVLILDMKWGG